MERKLVQESGIPFAAYHEVHAGPLHGVDPFTVVSSAAKLCLGTLQAFNRLRSLRPGVALLTGGLGKLAAGAWGAYAWHTDRDLIFPISNLD